MDQDTRLRTCLLAFRRLEHLAEDAPAAQDVLEPLAFVLTQRHHAPLNSFCAYRITLSTKMSLSVVHFSPKHLSQTNKVFYWNSPLCFLCFVLKSVLGYWSKTGHLVRPCSQSARVFPPHFSSFLGQKRTDASYTRVSDGEPLGGRAGVRDGGGA